VRKLRSLISRSQKVPLRKQEHQTYNQKPKVDLPLLGLVIFLTLFGLLMVYDASQAEAFNDFGDSYHFIKQQVVWVGLGLVGLTFFSIFNYRYLEKFALPLLIFSLVLLMLVFIPGLGVSAGGAHRWLKVGGITIQPAEVIKFATIIFFATLFQKNVRTGPFLITVGIVSVLVGLLQKDLGSAIIFNLIAFGMYFLANGPIMYFIPLMVLGGLGAVGFVATSAYRIKRIMAFLDPFADPQGYSYHISQVLIALGSGGLLGLGVGQSRQKYSFVPEVTTDSIFSVVGEEFGFLGGVILILAFAFLVLRGLKIAERAPDTFGRLLASGLTIWLGSQAVVNLAAMVSLIPLTGVPLPFISYGGSAILANLAAVGILLNISKQSTK
jgi:cell division protein FtsW